MADNKGKAFYMTDNSSTCKWITDRAMANMMQPGDVCPHCTACIRSVTPRGEGVIVITEAQ